MDKQRLMELAGIVREGKFKADMAVDPFTGGDPNKPAAEKILQKYGLRLRTWHDNGPSGFPMITFTGPDRKAQKFFQDVYDEEDIDIFKV